MRALAVLLLMASFVATTMATYKPPHPYDKDQVMELWNGFKLKYDRTYTPGEELKALFCFIENLGRIQELNANSKTARFGITVFADQCLADFRKTHGKLLNRPPLEKLNKSKLIKIGDYPWKKASLGKKDEKKQENNGSKVLEPSNNGSKVLEPSAPPPPGPPDFIDYRTWGILREPVVNQGICGASAYFSVTVMLEAAVSLWLDYNITLSAQELIDCTYMTYPYENDGCNGGLMDICYDYIMNEGGIASEAQYPYTASTDTCVAISNKPIGISFWGWFDHSEAALKFGVWAGGPVSIGLAALDDGNFLLYEDGILDNCMYTTADSGLVLVGYNTAATVPYWIVRNSWGTDWGYDGYMYLAYGTNECGILDYPGSQAIVEFN